MIDIMHGVAIVVMFHIGRHVCLIMPEMIRRMVSVVTREMLPIVWRTPVCVCRTAETVKQRRTFIIYRLDNVVRAVDVRSTDHLHIRRCITHLYHQRSYILIDISCQHSLNEQHMRMTFKGFQHTQVVDITVAVQVEVGDHVRVGVQDHLKLLNRVRLRERGSYSLQVEIEADILCERGDVDGCGACGACAGIGDRRADGRGVHDLCLGLGDNDGCRGCGFGHYDRLGSGSDSDNTGYSATCHH